MMEKRTPYDGKPYYCALCELGLGEYMACEEGDCELETVAEAQMRAIAHCQYQDGPFDICRACGGEKLGHHLPSGLSLPSPSDGGMPHGK
jgi:hypothetical protein